MGLNPIDSFWEDHSYGFFLLGWDSLRRYFDIFKCFKGALDHLLTRIQFLRFSVSDRLSWDLRLSCFLKNSPLIEKSRLLSFPVLLSMNDRLFFCIEKTSIHWCSLDGYSSVFQQHWAMTKIFKRPSMVKYAAPWSWASYPPGYRRIWSCLPPLTSAPGRR